MCQLIKEALKTLEIAHKTARSKNIRQNATKKRIRSNRSCSRLKGTVSNEEAFQKQLTNHLFNSKSTHPYDKAISSQTRLSAPALSNILHLRRMGAARTHLSVLSPRHRPLFPYALLHCRLRSQQHSLYALNPLSRIYTDSLITL